MGDTVALVRTVGHQPVLCIEGSTKFLPLLAANAERLGNVEIEPLFVGPDEFSGQLQAQHRKGTAALVQDDARNGAPIESRLDRRPTRQFARPQILKIDTDGFDAFVLRSAESLLRRAHPVLFFEYFPDMIDDADRLPEVFVYLSDLGYRRR